MSWKEEDSLLFSMSKFFLGLSIGFFLGIWYAYMMFEPYMVWYNSLLSVFDVVGGQWEKFVDFLVATF